MEHDPHSSPIKTPKQLIIVVVLAFAIPIALAGLLSQLATSGSEATDESKAAVIARIKPVGTIVMAEASGAGGTEPAPTVPVPIATATAAPAGAAPVAAATAVAASTVAAAATPAAPATTAVAAPALAVASTGGSDAGKKVYDETCHVCHATGLLGSPKFGDKAAWAPRIATGMDTLYNAALHGLNSMPPRGGNANLTDAEVKAAVNYMTAAAK